MPITGIQTIATVVILATMTGQEIQSPVPTQTSVLQTSAKPSEVIVHTGRTRTPKLTQKRPQKPLRTKLSQNR